MITCVYLRSEVRLYCFEREIAFREFLQRAYQDHELRPLLRGGSGARTTCYTCLLPFIHPCLMYVVATWQIILGATGEASED